MTIDWKAEAAARQDAFLADLQTLLSVPSVRDDAAATTDAPVGPGPKAALEAALAIAERDGFETTNIDNLVGYIEYAPEGADDDHIALLGHVDVVGPGEGWATDPFTPVIEDGKVIARGASDDKGPTLAGYYALKTIRDLQIPLKHRVRLIIGTDEESGWSDMDRYFEVEKQPLMGFSPDAEYPIINGEKGNVTFQINFTGDNSGDLTLVNFDAGIRLNMVPGVARAIVTGTPVDRIAVEFEKFLNANETLSGNAEVDEAGAIKLELHGKQVHGAMPETGVNAGTYLANFLSQFNFGGNAAAFLGYLGGALHDTPFADKLGIAFEDDVMGKLSLNIGIQKFVDGGESLINTNFRFPKGITPADIEAGLIANLNGWTVVPEQQPHTQEPHYVSPDDALVKTLLNIYHEQTGLPAHDQVIGGGTYGRLMTRGVAFGALFPDSPDTMHQVNEFALVDDLVRSISIYAQAIAELGNLD